MKNLFKNTSGVSVVGVQPNTIFLSTLKNSGHNNYTAIADIIDNSLENDVDAKNVWIYLKPDKNILIVDDGSGMNKKTLEEALKLGSLTGKDKTIDLGNYGTGLKSAGLSLGNKIIVRTKEKDDDFFIGIFDHDELINNNKWEIPIDIGSDEEYEYFKSLTNSENGTIIEITNLEDRVNKNVSVFRDTLINKLSLIYKYIIEEKNVNIFVNNKKVVPFDPMYRKESFSIKLTEDNQQFDYNSKTYKFNCYFLESLSESHSKEIERNTANAGLYVYRNYRLVGSGLGLGIINKHGDGYLNGFRAELFIDGEDDEIFSSSYLKIISEKDKNEIDQGFRDIFLKNINPFVITARNRAKNKEKEKKDTSENYKKAKEKALEDIKKNKFVNRKRKLDKSKNNSEIKDIINKGKNAFSHRNRGTWCDVREIDLGEYGDFCQFQRENGKLIINLNKSHVFFDEFINVSDDKTIIVIIKLLASLGLAQEDQLNYFDNPDEAEIINKFINLWSEGLRRLIKF